MGRLASTTIALGAAWLLLGTSLPALASLPFYVTIEGQQQGPIEGSVTAPGRENTIEGQELHHLVTIPTDPNGTPAGSPQHETLIFTKYVDKSSPSLMRAMHLDEFLTIDVRFYRVGPSGQEEHYYTIRLVNARVVAIEPFTPQARDPGNNLFSDHERVRITYGEITWTWEPDAIEFSWQPGQPGA